MQVVWGLKDKAFWEVCEGALCSRCDPPKQTLPQAGWRGRVAKEGRSVTASTMIIEPAHLTLHSANLQGWPSHAASFSTWGIHYSSVSEHNCLPSNLSMGQSGWRFTSNILDHFLNAAISPFFPWFLNQQCYLLASQNGEQIHTIM